MDIDVDEDEFGLFDVEATATNQRANRTAIPRVSFSPSELPAVDLPVPTKPSTKPNVNKKKARVAMLNLTISRPFVFIRPNVFDSNQFGKDFEVGSVYSEEDMVGFEKHYQKQLNFNFSQKRFSKKKAESEGRASRSAAALDLSLWPIRRSNRI